MNFQKNLVAKPHKTSFDYLPDTILRKNIVLEGYVIGNRVGKPKDLTCDHFDSIQFVRYSQNPKERGVFFHAIGYRKQEDDFTMIVCRLLNFNQENIATQPYNNPEKYTKVCTQ